MELYSVSFPSLGVNQVKILIPHFVYQAYSLLPQDTKEDEAYAKGFLKKFTKGYEWFTERSPYYEGIKSGMYGCNLKQPIEIKVTKL